MLKRQRLHLNSNVYIHNNGTGLWVRTKCEHINEKNTMCNTKGDLVIILQSKNTEPIQEISSEPRMIKENSQDNEK